MWSSRAVGVVVWASGNAAIRGFVVWGLAVVVVVLLVVVVQFFER